MSEDDIEILERTLTEEESNTYKEFFGKNYARNILATNMRYDVVGLERNEQSQEKTENLTYLKGVIAKKLLSMPESEEFEPRLTANLMERAESIKSVIRSLK